MRSTFVLKRETKGAVLYEEVDSNGRPLDMAHANIGSLYIRKSSDIGKKMPPRITVEVAVGG